MPVTQCPCHITSLIHSLTAPQPSLCSSHTCLCCSSNTPGCSRLALCRHSSLFPEHTSRLLMAHFQSSFRLYSITSYSARLPAIVLELSTPLPGLFSPNYLTLYMLLTSFMPHLSPLLEDVCSKRSDIFVYFTKHCLSSTYNNAWYI